MPGKDQKVGGIQKEAKRQMKIITCPACDQEILLIPDGKNMGKAIQKHIQEQHDGNPWLEHIFCIKALVEAAEESK
jgi:hypothetical protein